MKKMSLRTTVCCIACTLLAATAWAQREPGSSPSSSQRPQGAPGSQSQRSTSYSSSMHGQQSLRVSQQVINAQVKTQDGQQLGQIEDLIANPQTGKIEFAVVSKGDKLCPIPMQLLQLQPQGAPGTSTSGTTSGTSTTETTPSTTPGTPGLGRSGAQAQRVTFVAQVDKQKLEQGPSFSRTQWPEISSSWSQQIYSHYGVQPEAAGGTGSSTSSQERGKSSSTTTDPSSDTEKRSKEKSEEK